MSFNDYLHHLADLNAMARRMGPRVDPLASNGISNLHQSPNWGKAHVDIGASHGHSPTLNPPRTVDGVTELGDRKDLPAPFGPTPGYPNDIGNR